VIVVAGGTGRLGSAVVTRLLGAGHGVRVLSRGLSGEAPAGAEHVRCDVRSPEDVARALTGADLVLSAVQGFAGPGGVTPRSVDREGNFHLISAARDTGADVVLVSVTHAAADSPLEIAREKHAAERALHASGVAGTVVRAAGFAELWIQLMEDTAGRSRRPLVFGRGETPFWWVSVEDVASEVAAAALDPSTRGRTLEVVGPEGLSLQELARRVMLARGWDGEPRRIPRAALRVGAMTAGRLRPSLGRQMRSTLAFDELGAESPAAVAQGLSRTTVDQLLTQHRSVR